jgi:hypothetical protein
MFYLFFLRDAFLEVGNFPVARSGQATSISPVSCLETVQSFIFSILFLLTVIPGYDGIFLSNLRARVPEVFLLIFLMISC